MIFNMLEIVGIVLIGLFMGLLVTYLADVLPYTRRLSQPICTACQRKLTWRDYLFSYRCAKCSSTYTTRRWILLLLFLAASIFLWFLPPLRFNYWLGMVLLVYLAVIFIIDLEHRVILHQTSIVGAILFFFLGIFLHGFIPTLIGGATGFLIMLGLHYLGQLFSQWLAKRRGQELSEPALGFGDVNFAGVIGLGLGWPGIVAGLVLAILLGGVTSLIYLLYTVINRRYQLFLVIPYAPFMVLATIFLLFRN